MAGRAPGVLFCPVFSSSASLPPPPPPNVAMADAAPPPPPAAAPAGAPAGVDEAEEAEGFGASDLLMDSVNKMEWKNIEAALTYQKKNVAEMLRKACSQIRIKGEMTLDDSNGKFLSDMLPEMEDFSTWCYATHIRPKLAKLPLDLPEELPPQESGKGKKKAGGGGGGGGGGGAKGGASKGGKGGKGKEEKISAKTQIKIDNVMRIMNGEAAKTSTLKKVQVGDRAVGWLEALEPGKNLVLDAPWEFHLAKEMGSASALLMKKKGDSEKDSEEARYRSVRNLADGIVIYEAQYRLHFGVEELPPMQILVDARHVLDQLKVKVKFTVHKCLRKHPQLLSSSQFKTRHASKFLQPYPSQVRSLGQ